MKTAVKDVMTTRVIWVKRAATFREMVVALREHRVSAFPVIDGLLHRRDQSKAHGVTAGDLMTAQVVTVAPEDTVEHAARLMYHHKVKRLPVTDATGHLVGIVSRADVLAVFDRTDEDIRIEITDEVLRRDLVVDPRIFDVTVSDGVVTLAGAPETNDFGREIVQRVRHVPGVVAVRDRFSYPAPEHPLGRFDVLTNFPTD